MRIGIIDLGTNSVRFDIYDINPLVKNQKRLYREKIMIKLGQEIFHSGKLNTEAKKRTLIAFERFAKIAKHFKTQKTIAFATSALREAKNPDSFLLNIYNKTGIQIEIISGKREAELIARGILKNVKTPSGTFGLIDIGGGSTEISICKGKKILFSESFPIGTARIQQLHLKKIPPTVEGILQSRYSIQMAFRRGLENAHPKTKIKSVPKMIGSSGTIKALDRMMRNRFSKKQIDIYQLNKLISQMEPMNYQQLTQIPCMESKRIDQIVSGSIILQEFMRALNTKEVKFTEFCLRDGIFDEQLEKASLSKSNGDKKSLVLKSFIDTAVGYGEAKPQLEFLSKLTQKFFTETQNFHKLPSNLLFYLQGAMIFRNIGEIVNYNDHGKHSAYIIGNLNLNGIEKWEADFIAFLCRFHDEKYSNFDEIKKFARQKLIPIFKKAKLKELNTALILKTFAILHILNNLDLQNLNQKIKLTTSFEKNNLYLACPPRQRNQLDLSHFEQSSLFFKTLFNSKLHMEVATSVED